MVNLGRKLTNPSSRTIKTARKLPNPAKKVTNPVKKVTIPVKKVTSPAGKVTSPVKKVTSPAGKVKSPVTKMMNQAPRNATFLTISVTFHQPFILFPSKFKSRKPTSKLFQLDFTPFQLKPSFFLLILHPFAPAGALVLIRVDRWLAPPANFWQSLRDIFLRIPDSRGNLRDNPAESPTNAPHLPHTSLESPSNSTISPAI